jgi:hypothetical protein
MHYMVDVYTWAGAHTVTYLQVLILIVLLFVVWSWAYNRKPSVRRELQMDLDRKAKVRALVRDAYVNALYDKMRTKEITYDEYQREMLRLRKDMGFDVVWKINLHPKAIKAELEHLKDSIKGRLPEEKVQAAVTRAKAAKPTKGNGKLNVPMKA